MKFSELRWRMTDTDDIEVDTSVERVSSTLWHRVDELKYY